MLSRAARRLSRAFRTEPSSAAAFGQQGAAEKSDGPMVVAYHPVVRRIGHELLASGGNAFDAFVAAAIAENVVAEGASSLGGSLTALIRSAAERRTCYLDGGFDEPGDGGAGWRPGRSGRAVLVPGAPAALSALWRRYGSLPWARLVEPGLALARDGFTASRLMESVASVRRRVLRSSDQGRAAYLRDGSAPAPGTLIRLPQMAEFLDRFAAEGPDYVYRGAWSERFLEAVAAAGGRLTRADLEGYEARWFEPHRADYRGDSVESSSGRSYGGLWVQLALAALERAEAAGLGAGLPVLARRMAIARGVWGESGLFDARILDDPRAAARLVADGADAAVDRAFRGPTPARARGSAHSYALIVRDGLGNVVNGTISAECEPWAMGLFVQGVLLTAAGRTPFGVAPGERRLSAFSQHFVHRGGEVRLAVGTISNSAPEAAFQLVAALAEPGQDLDRLVSEPRFGTFPPKRWRLRPTPDLRRMWVDPRVDSATREAIAELGVRMSTRTPVDTGLGAILRAAGAEVEGATLPLPYIASPFADG